MINDIFLPHAFKNLDEKTMLTIPDGLVITT
jgi:hypothetical protein